MAADVGAGDVVDQEAADRHFGADVDEDREHAQAQVRDGAAPREGVVALGSAPLGGLASAPAAGTGSTNAASSEQAAGEAAGTAAAPTAPVRRGRRPARPRASARARSAPSTAPDRISGPISAGATRVAERVQRLRQRAAGSTRSAASPSRLMYGLAATCSRVMPLASTNSAHQEQRIRRQPRRRDRTASAPTPATTRPMTMLALVADAARRPRPPAATSAK